MKKRGQISPLHGRENWGEAAAAATFSISLCVLGGGGKTSALGPRLKPRARDVKTLSVCSTVYYGRERVLWLRPWLYRNPLPFLQASKGRR